ncbi:MAG: hypothetical protein ACJAT4_000151 [Granulosicoccus sp.]|jgi:hypothetical protein
MKNKIIIFMELENKLIDYLDDALTAVQRAEVEKQLKNSAELRQTLDELKMVMNGMETAEEFQPSLNLKNNFDQFLQKEIDNQGGGDVNIVAFKKPNSGRTKFLFQIAAAAAILFLGIFVGKNLGGEPQVTPNDLAVLRAEMLDLLEKDKSTSGRIKAVNISYELQPDDEIIEALIQSMNIDKSINVRIAAMEALSQIGNEPKVRTALCKSLGVQSNSMIQLSLIKILVNLKEKQAVEYFEKIIEKETTAPEVKDEAQMGIFKMM